MRMNLGREVCGKESQASTLEWLLANGLGGYASGTVSGRPTRGYHGLLVAAGTPAQGRVLLLAALAEELEGDSGTFELATFGWQGGAVAFHCPTICGAMRGFRRLGLPWCRKR